MRASVGAQLPGHQHMPPKSKLKQTLLRPPSPLSQDAQQLLSDFRKLGNRESGRRRPKSVFGSTPKRKKNTGIHSSSGGDGSVLLPGHHQEDCRGGASLHEGEVQRITPPSSDQEDCRQRTRFGRPTSAASNSSLVLQPTAHQESFHQEDCRPVSPSQVRVRRHGQNSAEEHGPVQSEEDLRGEARLRNEARGIHHGEGGQPLLPCEGRPHKSDAPDRGVQKGPGEVHSIGGCFRFLQPRGVGDAEATYHAVKWLMKLSEKSQVEEKDQHLLELCKGAVYNGGDLCGVDVPQETLKFWIDTVRELKTKHCARGFYLWQIQNRLFGSRLAYLQETFPEIFTGTIKTNFWERYFTEKGWTKNKRTEICDTILQVILMTDKEGRLVLHFHGGFGTGKSILSRNLCGPWRTASISNLQLANKSEFTMESALQSSIICFDEPMVNPIAGQELRKVFAGDLVFAQQKYEQPQTVPVQPVIVTANSVHYGPFLPVDGALERRRRLVQVPGKWKYDDGDETDWRQTWRSLYSYLIQFSSDPQMYGSK